MLPVEDKDEKPDDDTGTAAGAAVDRQSMKTSAALKTAVHASPSSVTYLARLSDKLLFLLPLHPSSGSSSSSDFSPYFRLCHASGSSIFNVRDPAFISRCLSLAHVPEADFRPFFF